MDFEEMLMMRRSVRDYQDKPVPMEIVKKMIEDSTMAPSAGNEQPWKYIIVNDKKLLEKISDDSKKNILARIEADPDDYAKKYEKMLRNESYNVFYNAPCAVFIIGRKDIKNLQVDCALAAGYFMMSAVSQGLGTCWVNLALAITDPEIIKDLGIPEGCRIVAPIALGYPVKVPLAPKRNEPEIIKVVVS